MLEGALDHGQHDARSVLGVVVDPLERRLRRSRLHAELVELWRNGAVRPIVTGRFALADAAKAHRAIESRRTTGKIVLLP